MAKYYKGFDKDLKCRGFQYEIGGEYREDKADLCHAGFHACENPLDVFSYYSPGNGSRYCEVELYDLDDKRETDSKVCGKRIKIGAEIGIPGLVSAQIEWVKNLIGFDKAVEKANRSKTHHATGDQGAASATGLSSVALASGFCGRVMGNVGCAIFAVERGEFDGSTLPIISVAAAIVDGEKIKADTWYMAKNGELVEWEEQ